MRAVIQRTNDASVIINESVKRCIGKGLLIFIGIEEGDTREDALWLAAKISKLRIFSDAENIMNHSVCDVSGEIMIISQFTLHALTKKGNRPSYIRAARPETAVPLYEYFISSVRKETGLNVITGEFGAHMKVSLTNNGPVTILIDTKNRE
jgi:D-tyrosyl-tRNA(Tyr) deacylase